MKVTIVSSDKDFLQLVTEDISVFDPFNMARLGPNEVFEKYGVRPRVLFDRSTNDACLPRQCPPNPTN